VSAPVSRDPLVVTTADGMSWACRAVTQDGHGLYVLDGVCSCPKFLMQTFAELAERGITGQAFALPVPVGPGPSVVEPADKLTATFMATQVLREDPHDGPLHHDYRIPRDLPETGGRP
jgi:hypothetical protein